MDARSALAVQRLAEGLGRLQDASAADVHQLVQECRVLVDAFNEARGGSECEAQRHLVR